MPEELIEKIFNLFFIIKPTKRGIRVRLSLSNDIVREHGGSITPQPVEGDYVQFTVRLPANAH